MPKCPAERKAAQRARQAATGGKKLALAQQIEIMGHQQCGKCKEQLPVQSCPCQDEAACWVTKGWQETKLVI
ncbi:hypothetical protein [Pantoea agglomerans]|uniref:hypothetical protein n=1 Tax=Enterobacter agglomerans TaxID=549 RepID=UPI00320B8FF3